MPSEEAEISEDLVEPSTEKYLELIAQINEAPFDPGVFEAVASFAQEEEEKPSR